MHSKSSMRAFIILLSLCWPTTALSASFTPRTNAPHASLPSFRLHKSTHLRIPRGGQIESDGSEEVIDLDAPEEPVAVHVPAATTETAKCATSASLPMGFLAPLALAFQAAGSSYSSAITAYPIITKSVTAGVTFFLSDYTAQRIERPKDKVDKDVTVKKGGKDKEVKKAVWKHDWTRTLVSCAVGLFYFGPAAHAWYEWIFTVLPGTSLASTLQKAALGQVIFGPSFTCIFFAVSLMQAGEFSIGNWVSKIKKDLPGAWLSGTAFWPLVDLISFSVVPMQFIPLFINLCSFVWTIYLSMVANRSSANK